jgi:hypothetical protein
MVAGMLLFLGNSCEYGRDSQVGQHMGNAVSMQRLPAVKGKTPDPCIGWTNFSLVFQVFAWLYTNQFVDFR